MRKNNGQDEKDCIDVRIINKISRVMTKYAGWKESLDILIPLVREIFVFDTIILYQSDERKKEQDVLYARSIGRGRSQMDDLAWGDSIVTKVIETHKIVIQEPDPDSTIDRTDLLYVLGIPVPVHYHPLTAMVLIRCGGPHFTDREKSRVQLIADEIGMVLDHDTLHSQFQSYKEDRGSIISSEDLLSMVAHELLNPIGFIKGYTTTLLRTDIQFSKENQREFLSVIDEETDNLQELVNNILDSSRLQNGTMQMVNQPIRMDGLVKDTVLHIQQYYPDLKINLQIEPNLPSVHGDPRRLSQVIENLFTNAVKYAPGSSVEVKLDKTARDLHLAVIDHGPGMPPEVLSKLFKKYYRAPLAENIHGFGLGLFICREIIRAHNGEITIKSKQGMGTTVSILLPCSPMLTE